MHDVVLKSGWDTALYAAPLLATLFLGFFRLDELISTPRQRTVPRPKLTGNDKNGEPLLSDPDGRPWGPRSESAQARNPAVRARQPGLDYLDARQP